MKKVLFSAALMSSFALSGYVSATVDNLSLESQKQRFQTHKDNLINGEALDLSDLSLFADEFTDGQADKKSKTMTSQAAASGITYFEVYAVGSSNVGWEAYPTLQASSFSTYYDHGGSQLRVAVLQIGYGNVGDGVMNGQRKRPYYTEKLCGSDLHVCRNGESITGFMYYYDFDGMQNGTFTNSSASIASPYGTQSDSIYIQ